MPTKVGFRQAGSVDALLDAGQATKIIVCDIDAFVVLQCVLAYQRFAGCRVVGFDAGEALVVLEKIT